jgi:hypothetical protein
MDELSNIIELDDFPTVTREAAVSALELTKSLLVSRLV